MPTVRRLSLIHDVPPGVFVGEMAGSVLDSGGGRDELKTRFMTREGTYHLMTLAGTINQMSSIS